jgi:hypothetical protein
LNKLDEYLSILRNYERYSFEEFSASPELYGSAERFLHLAIETLTDLGNHEKPIRSSGRLIGIATSLPFWPTPDTWTPI